MKNKRVYPVILTPADNIILVEVSGYGDPDGGKRLSGCN